MEHDCGLNPFLLELHQRLARSEREDEELKTALAARQARTEARPPKGGQ